LCVEAEQFDLLVTTWVTILT